MREEVEDEAAAQEERLTNAGARVAACQWTPGRASPESQSQHQGWSSFRCVRLSIRRARLHRRDGEMRAGR